MHTADAAGEAQEHHGGVVALAVFLGVIAVLAIVAAIIYYASASQSLPAFMPGRRQGVAAHDMTRALAATGTAVVALVIAGISLARARSQQRRTQPVRPLD